MAVAGANTDTALEATVHCCRPALSRNVPRETIGLQLFLAHFLFHVKHLASAKIFG